MIEENNVVIEDMICAIAQINQIIHSLDNSDSLFLKFPMDTQELHDLDRMYK